MDCKDNLSCRVKKQRNSEFRAPLLQYPYFDSCDSTEAHITTTGVCCALPVVRECANSRSWQRYGLLAVRPVSFTHHFLVKTEWFSANYILEEMTKALACYWPLATWLNTEAYIFWGGPVKCGCGPPHCLQIRHRSQCSQLQTQTLLPLPRFFFDKDVVKSLSHLFLFFWTAARNRGQASLHSR